MTDNKRFRAVSTKVLEKIREQKKLTVSQFLDEFKQYDNGVLSFQEVITAYAKGNKITSTVVKSDKHTPYISAIKNLFKDGTVNIGTFQSARISNKTPGRYNVIIVPRGNPNTTDRIWVQFDEEYISWGFNNVVMRNDIFLNNYLNADNTHNQNVPTTQVEQDLPSEKDDQSLNTVPVITPNLNDIELNDLDSLSQVDNPPQVETPLSQSETVDTGNW